MELRARALQLLALRDIEEKPVLTLALQAQAATLEIALDTHLHATEPLPGHPGRPLLLPHADVRRRSPATAEGRATLIHAICHIEFNAINLALDAIWRFPGMPAPYYLDWLRVAAEEARHFTLPRTHLRQYLGHDYGDFPAHQGLWSMCEKTASDITARRAAGFSEAELAWLGGSGG